MEAFGPPSPRRGSEPGESGEHFGWSLTEQPAGFVGPVVHIVFASVWGYYVGRACLEGRGLLRITLTALAGTAILHGLYDYLVIALPRFALPASAMMVLALWLWRMFLIRDLHLEARESNAG